MWLGNRKKFAARFAVVPMFHCYRAEHDIRAQIRREKAHLLLNFLRQEIIVCVEILQPVPSRQFEKPVARNISAAIPTGLPTNPSAKALNNIETAISGTIVDYDHFLFGPRLRKRAFNRLRNPLFSVETWHQDRH